MWCAPACLQEEGIRLGRTGSDASEDRGAGGRNLVWSQADKDAFFDTFTKVRVLMERPARLRRRRPRRTRPPS